MLTHRHYDASLALDWLTDECSDIGLRDGLLQCNKIVERDFVDIGNDRTKSAKPVPRIVTIHNGDTHTHRIRIRIGRGRHSSNAAAVEVVGSKDEAGLWDITINLSVGITNDRFDYSDKPGCSGHP